MLGSKILNQKENTEIEDKKINENKLVKTNKNMNMLKMY